jgi:thiamine-phosphate pyrophosphorylase
MSATLRIIDANANRAREALRVMEDIARFALNSENLSRDVKQLRHDLRSALESASVDIGGLLASRDTPGDVGTGISTEAETDRKGLHGVAVAAQARLAEALRSIEECIKSLGQPAAASAIGALRYRGYQCGRILVLALGSAQRRQQRLCVLITESLCRRPWEEVAYAAIDGGADYLQLREKTLGDAELLRRARWLVEITRQHDTRIIINDRPDIALLSGAFGVHLGQTDLSVADARRIVGLSLLIGVSTENIDQARAAAAEGADYCGLGPMFATTTKDKPTIAGPAYLREYLADATLSQLPHFAIGGISPANIAGLVDAGCRGVAVSSAVCGADDPGEECRKLQQELLRGELLRGED